MHWIDGGQTDLDNLILLCEPHHLAHHNGEFAIDALGAGRFRFRDPHGRQISPALPDVDPSTVAEMNSHFADLDQTAATSNWDGRHLERHYAIAVLAQRRQLHRAEPEVPDTIRR